MLTTVPTRLSLPRHARGARAAVPPTRATADGPPAGDEHDVEEKPKKRHHRHHHHVRPKPKPGPPIGGAVNRPVAYLPPHKLSLTPEERAAPPLTPVERGREEVSALCSVLPEGSEEKHECEEALEYYERMAAGEGDACSVAAAASSSPSAPLSSRYADPNCAEERERFESFVRELLYANTVSGFVKALGRRKREEERRKERGAGTSGGDGASGAVLKKIDADTERRREALVALFRRYDRDGNGTLDAAEFREASAAAGDPLTGGEVSKIFDALDIHVGQGITLDDFLQAVEAEDFMKPASPLAAWLRAHADGGVGEVELPGRIDQL